MTRPAREQRRSATAAALIAAVTLNGCAVVHRDVPWGLVVGEAPADGLVAEAVSVDWEAGAGLAEVRATRRRGRGVRLLEVRGTMTELKGMAGQVARAGTAVFVACASVGPRGLANGFSANSDGAAVAALVILAVPAVVGLGLALPAWAYALVSLPFYAVWSGDRWYGLEGERVSPAELRDEALARTPGFAAVAAPHLWIAAPPVAQEADEPEPAQPEWEPDDE